MIETCTLLTLSETPCIPQTMYYCIILKVNIFLTINKQVVMSISGNPEEQGKHTPFVNSLPSSRRMDVRRVALQIGSPDACAKVNPGHYVPIKRKYHCSRLDTASHPRTILNWNTCKSRNQGKLTEHGKTKNATSIVQGTK